MLENQFIKTDVYRSFLGEVKPLPVAIGVYVSYFFAPTGTLSISVLFENKPTQTVQIDSTLINLSSLINNAGVVEGDRFVMQFVKQSSSSYSQPLIRVSATYFTWVRYRCDEDAFGFPFSQLTSNQYVSHPLQLRLHSPQNEQDDKTYVKANGEVVTLYAKYYKEWEGETEYLSEEMHDKIVAALSCDEVYIDGKRVTKTDSYKVSWDNYDLDCDGTTKLAKATFKVREHITKRNSNY